MLKLTKERIEFAKFYASQSVKEGYTSPEDWEGLTTRQLVKKAEYEGERGDDYANGHES